MPAAADAAALPGQSTLKDGTARTLGKSRSMPTLRSASGSAGHSLAAAAALPGVSLESLRAFLFPLNQENPESTGRFELLSKLGPTDEDGHLRGGVGGTHVHTDGEVKQMIRHNCREALFSLFKKSRDTVESVVDTLLPVALGQKYIWDDVMRILRRVPLNKYGRLDLMSLQDAVATSQHQRLKAICQRAEEGKPIAPPAEKLPTVPFQSEPARRLMKITHKKKFTENDEQINYVKRLHSYNTLIASIEDQSKCDQLRNNVLLMRIPGDVNDRFDRYCALRRTGRSSYVGARNSDRYNPSLDDGLANKHPYCSSLLAASAGGSSAAAILGAT